MKKWYYLIILGMISFFPIGVVAVPAYPGLVKLLQPSGEEITVNMRGDEKVHWMESPDGYSLMYDKDKRIVFATTDETGNMVPSSIVYRDALLRSSIDKQLANIPKRLRYSASQVSMLKKIWDVTKSSMEQAAPKAATGTIRAICPLVGFPNLSFKKTKEEFEQLMNQAGYTANGAKGSVHDFYHENSYGQMNLVVTVVGPYTASHDLNYYGGNESGGNENISHMIELAREIAKYTFNEPDVNPADYDNDGDGYIDAFHFIFAGYGEESSGNEDDIWSHALPGFTPAFTFGNKILNRYSCSPELRGNKGSNITRIGVICHEMGHIFGLPDFYDADGDGSGGNYSGTGFWDLMAEGSWNGAKYDGSSPAHINMYSKIQLGWVDPVILDSPQDIIGMPNSAMYPDAYVYNTSIPGEYYVLENRQKEGFDNYIPGSGLLIYHVSLTDENNRDNTVNNAHPQRMYPVCASSRYQIPSGLGSYGAINSAGCPFPGTSRNTSFTDATTPAAFTWTGMKVNRPVTEIREQDKLISFKFMQTGAEPVSDLTLAKDGYNVQLNWNKPNESVLGYNIYRGNKLLIKLTGADNTSYIQNNVSSGIHTYCVAAYYDRDEESVLSCREINIEGNPNRYLPVRDLNVAIQGKSVELTWNPPVAENDWLTHSNDIRSVIYFNDTEKFSAVVRFTEDDLKGFVGSRLSQVNFYIQNINCKHTIQVWHFAPEPDKENLPDVNPMIVQPVQNIRQGVTAVNLDSPLKIEAGKELWIGINYELTPMTHVAAIDNGPKVPYRNLLIIDNTWYSLESSNYNFYITAGLALPDTPDKYYVYRNNAWLNNVTTEYYMDDAVPAGNHIYCISAVYDDQESERLCVQSPFLTGMIKINPSGNIKTYPNPLKQGEILTVDLGNDFVGARLSFYSVSGQLLLQTEVSESVYRRKIDFAPGVYTLQIRKKSQIINRKIIVNL
ncbi:MAG: M6 family metalloprotease domain-containing protein [Dysgonamonadaceae bacterium]|jgi:M6 family metalloprotease-like protein|nr:M6 family metalloprotease domain-containing protein [Dysgonamonadaceae bacterium]